jgi:PAS domain S-box-containing protein
MMDLTADRLKVIINSISDGVFTIDLDFKVNFINQAALNILNISESESIGKKCYEIMDNETCKSECPLRKTLRSGKAKINRPICLSINKNRKPISVSTAPIYDDNHNIVGGVETFRDLSQVEKLRKELKSKFSFEDIIGKSSSMQRLFDLVSLVAKTDSTVLIEGESGVGKELFANAIHSLSNRSKMPMVSINCSALPDTLLESELFGYVAGAFTDARKDKKGRFALAEGGTIFLDEIGELSHMVQVKLLRVLQERRYEPLGSTKSINADVRIVTATNRNLEQMVDEKKFRKDFYYRINVMKITVPPLRERKEDIPLLIDHFINKFNHIYGKRIEGISPIAMSMLMQYDFPGNVRELENFIEHAFILCREPLIRPDHLPEKFNRANAVPAIEIASNMNELEAVFLISVLKKNNWNRKKTAEELSMNPSTLFRKFKKLGINPPKK